MVSWPPSPFVEDETTALAHEFSVESSIDLLKSDNQGALSRGSVDQYPIIIDTPPIEILSKVSSKGLHGHQHSGSDFSSSEDTIGPSTPPSSYMKRSKPNSQFIGATSIQQHATDATANSAASANHQARLRNRPPINRIQTDIRNDAFVTTDNNKYRYKPSLGPVSRAQTFDSTTTGHDGAKMNLLSPYDASSPMVHGQPQRLASVLNTGESNRSGTWPTDVRSNGGDAARSKSEHRQKAMGRRDGADPRRDGYNRPESKGPYLADDTDLRRSRSYHELPTIQSGETLQASPAHSRKRSQDSTYGKDNEREHPTGAYPPLQLKRPTKDSPYYSSAEESSRGYARTSAPNSSDEQQRPRRRSSHRRERPMSLGLGEKTNNQDRSTSAVTDVNARTYYGQDPRAQDRPRPTTPLSSDMSKAAMEDYFVKAFQANEMRKSQRSHLMRGNGSIRASPTTSPPRTPRTDRTSKDYFEINSSMQRGSQRSRQSSMDEGPLKDSKQPATLLSAATAGAAHLARSSGTSSKGSDLWTEAVISAPNSKPGSAARSRRSSLLKEQPEELFTNHARTPLTPTFDTRPVSRGSFHGSDSSYAHPPQWTHPAPPNRTVSHAGFEHGQTRNGQHSLGNLPPQSYSARPSVPAVESSVSITNALTLPKCPRSQPTTGHRDWYTIREMSDIDICPTCMTVVGNTRYRDLFIPSLARPYNGSSVCVMSRPWVRIAFLQSLRQNRPNLDAIRAITSPRKDVRPCPGSKKDIRKWFYAVDPRADKAVAGFSVCTACVTAIDKLFPDVCTVFERPKKALNEERSCSLHIDSKHFPSVVDQLEQADARCRGRPWRPADVEPLMRHLWRVARYQPCPRDELQQTRAWHFMPDLPELTICEECYDHVVRPVEDRYVAREVSKTLKTVPTRRGSNGTSGISCQLYSERMRKIFRDAVHYRDFKPLHEAVKTRFGAQQRLSEMNKLFEQDLRYGIDRRQDIERNREIWKTFE